MTAFPVLGFDPAPGDVVQVDALACTVRQALTTLAAVRGALASWGDPDAAWRGQAARAFRDSLGDLPPYLAQAEAGHEQALQALVGWAGELTALQTRAIRLEVGAAEAGLEVELAGSALGLARQRATAAPAGLGPPDAGGQVQAAEQRLRAAGSELTQARRAAQLLAGEHQAAAARVASALRAAADSAPLQPDTFARLGGALDSLFGTASAGPGQVWGLVQGKAHVLNELGDVWADLGTALGLLSVVPGMANPYLAAAALSFSGAALTWHGAADLAGASVPGETYRYDLLAVGSGAGSALATARRAAGGAAGWASGGRAAQDVGTAGSVDSTLVGFAEGEGRDQPFGHFVPDSRAQLALGLMNPTAMVLGNAVRHGAAKDRAAAKRAEQDRWAR